VATVFTAEVISAGQGGHAVVVPHEIAAGFESKRPPVVVHVNGSEYRSRLMVYGGKSYLGLRQDLLRRIGVMAGDTVEVDLQLDLERVEKTTPPGAAPIEPAELVQALAADPAAQAAYAALAPSHRAEYARWIGEGKRPDTRAERTAKTIRRLTAQA
jgi:hypothetical protein